MARRKPHNYIVCRLSVVDTVTGNWHSYDFWYLDDAFNLIRSNDWQFYGGAWRLYSFERGVYLAQNKAMQEYCYSLDKFIEDMISQEPPLAQEPPVAQEALSQETINDLAIALEPPVARGSLSQEALIELDNAPSLEPLIRSLESSCVSEIIELEQIEALALAQEISSKLERLEILLEYPHSQSLARQAWYRLGGIIEPLLSNIEGAHNA